MTHEQQITQSFVSHEYLATDPERVMAAVNVRLARRKRTATVAAAATAVMLVVAILAFGVVLTSGSARIGQPAPNASPVAASPLRPPANQAGYRRISFHGATLFVPAHFIVGESPCYVPTADSIELSAGATGAVYNCQEMHEISTPPTFTNIALMPADDDPNSATARTHITVDGAPGLHGSGKILGQSGILAASSPVTVIVIPRANLSIDIAGPNQQSAARSLLESIHIAKEDDLGCAAQIATLTPHGNSPAAVFVPSAPVSGVVCEYARREYGKDAQWLYGSRVLKASELGPLAQFLNEWAQSTASGTTTADLTDQYRLLEPTGTTRTVAVSLGGSGLMITDGNRSIGVDYALTDCFATGCTPKPLPNVYDGGRQ